MLSRRTGLGQILLGGLASAACWRDASADTVHYAYDALGRIVQVTYPDGAVITYSYDAVGNRTQVVSTSGSFTGSIAITGTAPVNLRTLANTAGYDGEQDADITFTLENGVTILGAAGAPNGGAGIDTGDWPGGYSIALALQISGAVYGGGGQGGAGGSYEAGAGAAGLGGDAIYCRLPIDIVVNSGGQVRAGGGGAGGGGSWFNTITDQDRAGGGGGGGFPNGPGGAAGVSYFGTGAQNGAVGTTSGGGAGGAGDSVVSSHGGGAGGAGAATAATGSNGTAASGSTGSGWTRFNPSNGAAPGYAIRKNGHTVPVTNSGTITGTVG